MDVSPKISKRKRLKTRRNLKKIKKRCDHATYGMVSESYNDSEKIVLKNIHNNVPSNRLTLFNKVIQSKTVIRGQVFHSVKQCKDINLSKSKKLKNSLQINLQLKRFADNKTSDYQSDCDLDVILRGHKIHDDNILNSKKDSVSIIRSLSRESYSPPMQSNLSSHSQDNFDLYEEFIDNIPIYLKELVPQLLLQDNDINKNKLCLQQIWMDMHFKKHDSDSFVLKCYTPIKNQLVDETPNVTCSTQFSQQDLESSRIVSESNGLQCSQYSNSAIFKHHYISMDKCSDNDSPEYIYYPHRLNQ